MPVVLGSNTASLRAIRSLNQVDETLGRVFERLSTGKRINRAADDAAGLSIVSTLNNRSRVLNRASLNLADAQSLLTIADGTLSAATNVVTRLAELAEQAANGTFSATQRAALDREYQVLTREINRIGASTSFNGINLGSGGRSTRAGQFVGTSTTDALLDASGDGRYQISYDAADTLSVLEIRDSVTGEVRRLDGLWSGGTNYILDAKVLANGDVVIGASDLSSHSLRYYSWSSGSMRTLGSVTGSTAFSKLAVSGDGTTIAFDSDVTFADGGLLSTPGAPGVSRVYTLNIASGRIRAGISSHGIISDLKVSNDGRYVAATQPTGTMIYNFSGASGGVTATNIGSSTTARVFGITNEGVVYLNTSQNIGGQNSTGFQQVMSYNITTGSFARLSNFASNTKDNLSMNADGTALFFLTTASLESGTSTGGVRQYFRFDVLAPGATQLTGFTTNLGPSTMAISQDGGRVFRFENGNDLYEYDTTGADSRIDFEAGAGAQGNIIASIQAVNGAVRGLGSFTLGSAMQARAALDRMQSNLALLGQARSVIGAAQSRLSIAQNLTASQRDEALSASGRIADTDIAGESAELVRRSIQRDAAASILAQANQQPALAATLLRG